MPACTACSPWPSRCRPCNERVGAPGDDRGEMALATQPTDEALRAASQGAQRALLEAEVQGKPGCVAR